MNHHLTIITGFCLLLLLPFQSMRAQKGFFGDITVKTRLGYNIGGTAPVGLPRSIRKLNSYTPQPNPSIGIEGVKPVGKGFGVLVGLRFENKGMKEDARVKNYHMEIIRGGQSLEGMFTGDVETKVREWMVTVPVQATWDASPKVQLRLGPYVSVLTSKGFTGNAHDGYLRVGNPTGPKVLLGSDEGTRGTYEFGDHMRRVQWGVGAGADWLLTGRFGIYGELNWGLNGIHHSSFKTIEQTLYPIFGTVGILYRIK